MKPQFFVRETQDGGYAVFRFNALTGSFEQHSPKTGSTSKEIAENECEGCNHLAEEETIVDDNSKQGNREPNNRRAPLITAVIAILITSIAYGFNSKMLSEPCNVDTETSDEVISFLDEEGTCVVPQKYSWIYGGWEDVDGCQLLITKKGIRRAWNENLDVRRLEPVEFDYVEYNNKPCISYGDPETHYEMVIELDEIRDKMKQIEINDTKKERQEYHYNLEHHPACGYWEEMNIAPGTKRKKLTITTERFDNGYGWGEKVFLLKNGNLISRRYSFIYEADKDILFCSYSNTEEIVTEMYKRVK